MSKSSSGPTVVTNTVEEDFDYSMYPRYPAKTSQMLGLIQIVGGVGAIVAQSILFSTDSVARYSAAGLWSGILLITSGVFGIITGMFKTKCFIITTMTLTITAAVVSSIGISVSSLLGIFMDEDATPEFCDAEEEDCDKIDLMSAKNLNLILVIIAVVETFTLAWASALCCQTICGASEKDKKIKKINGSKVMVYGTVPAS